MKQKRISFKVAKAIKVAGYPFEYNDCNLIDICGCDYNKWKYWSRFINCTYLDVWLWLWKTNKVYLKIEKHYLVVWFDDKEELKHFTINKSPEKAISDAIDYLADNDLIK